MTESSFPPAEPVRCRATKNDGSPCRVSWGLSSGGLCFLHDPDRRAAAQAASAAGAATTGMLHAARREKKFRALAPSQLGGRPARTRREIERNLAAMNFAEGTGAVDPQTHREYVKGSLAHLKLINDRTLAREVRDLKRQVKAMKRGRPA